MTWKWNIFRSGLQGGYLVDSGFFCTVYVGTQSSLEDMHHHHCITVSSGNKLSSEIMTSEENNSGLLMLLPMCYLCVCTHVCVRVSDCLCVCVHMYVCPCV